jgi:hypothetical protein
MWFEDVPPEAFAEVVRDLLHHQRRDVLGYVAETWREKVKGPTKCLRSSSS